MICNGIVQIICEVFNLKIQIDDRCIMLGNYIVEHKSTVRAAAREFGISKSTVHTDVGCWNGQRRFKIVGMGTTEPYNEIG